MNIRINIVSRWFLLLLIVCPSVVFSQSSGYRYGEQIHIGPEDTLQTQLFAAGEKVDLLGVMENDLFVAGKEITMEGYAADDAFLAGRSLFIRGQIRDMLAGAGETIFFEAISGGDLFVAGREIRISGNSAIAGNMALAGDRIRIEEGWIGGWARIAGRSVFIDGHFQGPVEIYSNDVTFGENYRARGGSRLVSRSPIEEDQLGYAPADLEVTLIDSPTLSLPRVDFWYYLSLLMSGFILIALFRPSIQRLHNYSADRIWKNSGIGFLAFIVTPVIILLLVIPLITLPLAMLLAAFYGFSLFFSHLLAALLLGMLIMSRLRDATRSSAWYWSLIIGLTGIALITSIPFIGTFISFLILFFGLGSFSSYLWTRRDERDEKDTGNPSDLT